MTWNSISQITDFLRWTKKNLSPAVQRGTREWADEELPKRFEFGNTERYNYTPNTSQYQSRKNSRFGLKPQLVVNGALRDRVVNGKRISTFGMTLTYPRYGLYQRQKGRDFTIIRNDDIKEIKKRSSFYLRKWMKARK